MGKLSTQPATAQVVPLRSGFYALPFDSATVHLYARVHTAEGAEEEDAGGAATNSSLKLFVTGLPLGVTEQSLQKTVQQLYPRNQVVQVELLPPSSSSPSPSLLSREIVTKNSQIDPLFPSNSTSTTPIPSSALITFTSSPSLPPSPYPAATRLYLAPAPSFLARSTAQHSLARPHPSTIIAHSDTWMSHYDQSKLASIPTHYLPPTSTTTTPSKLTATQRKKLAKQAKQAGSLPVPGSAAYALMQHQAEQSKARSRSFNPDQVDEGEWTLVTGGGKHGKSLLPTGVTPSIMGYGEGRTVKVAKGGQRKGKGLLDDGEEEGSGEEEAGDKMDQGVKKIVGDGFYSFVKNQQRRDQLTSLANKFEQDKARLDRFRGQGGGSNRGTSRGGRGGGGRGGRGASSRGAREGRSFKPY